MRLIDADLLGLSDMEIIMCNGDYKEALKMLIDKIEHAPTIKPERKTGCLTEDEIKTIRIHMNAFKERLCNQHRWKEAEEYQQIVDKLDVMLPQPEQRWISSGEKPPEEGRYLVWMPFAPPKHRMAVAEYCGGHWNIKTPISAWMPLPKPYMEEEE